MGKHLMYLAGEVCVCMYKCIYMNKCTDVCVFAFSKLYVCIKNIKV